ncbi:MAG: hypothetical protein HKL87_03115 [Acidimicrobiaceae bacterium]|nr:hypothetical protein [Acidimicrobiaceae bacterium]
MNPLDRMVTAGFHSRILGGGRQVGIIGRALFLLQIMVYTIISPAVFIVAAVEVGVLLHRYLHLHGRLLMSMALVCASATLWVVPVLNELWCGRTRLGGPTLSSPIDPANNQVVGFALIWSFYGALETAILVFAGYELFVSWAKTSVGPKVLLLVIVAVLIGTHLVLFRLIRRRVVVLLNQMLPPATPR